MAYKGFVGSGTVGHFATTTVLELQFPAQLHAGRMATVEVVAGSATHYFSDGLSWKPQALLATDPLTGMAAGLVGLGYQNVGIAVYPVSAAVDSLNVQAAATLAMAFGKNLILGPGAFNLTTGIACNDGIVGSTGSYKGLHIYGAGSSNTTVNLAQGIVGFWWHTQGKPLNAMSFCGIHGLSIVGAGISGIGAGTIGFQVGGKESARSNLTQTFTFDDIVIDNVQTCAIFDDCTGIKGFNFAFLRYKYGFEWGYNIDEVDLGSFTMGFNDSNLAGAIISGITNGVSTFTVSAPVAAQLQVGYNINITNSLGVAVFPAETYVGTIAGTTITARDYKGTAVNAILASGTATTGSFYVGRAFNFGARLLDTVAGTLYPQYGSPFVSPYWSATGLSASRGRTNANQHKYFGAVSSSEMIADIGGSSHFDIEFHIYDERVTEPYRLGDAGQILLARNLKWEGCYPNSALNMQTPWINVLSSGGVDCELSVRNCSSDNGAQVQPYVCVPTFDGNIKVVWENNDLNMSGSNPNVSLYGPPSNGFAAKFQLAAYKALYAGSGRHGDAVVPVALGGAYAWNFCGQDGLALTLSAASTINNPAAGGTTCAGKIFTVTAIQGGAGGWTLTFGTQFKALNGAALGTIAAGTTGQRLIANFLWDGTYFWAQNTPTFVT